MTNKNTFVRVGDFFFKWRNILFPIIILMLFVSFVPPTEYFGSSSLVEIKDILSFIIILAGLGFRFTTIGWAYIKRGGLNKQVYADKLITEGYFNLCRNPLYVGNILIYTGIFFLHGHPVVALCGTVLFYFIYESIIAAEEYFLIEKFGGEYRRYCLTTRRWLPDFSNYKQAINGMEFSFNRAISKDYTTIFNTLFTVIILVLIAAYKNYPSSVFTEKAQVDGAIVLSMMLFIFIVKSLKKRGQLL